MNVESVNERTIRRYLLGTLSPEEAEVIELKFLEKEEFAQQIDLVEETLIDEYLEGELTSSERKAFENHFMRPPERRRRIAFARLLRAHLRNTELDKPVSAFIPFLPMPRSYLLAGAIAALIGITVLLGFRTSRLQKDLETARHSEAEVKKELLQQQARGHEVEKELALLRSPNPIDVAAKSTPLLTLNWVQLRDRADIPQVAIGAGAKELKVQIALVDVRAPAFQIRVHNPMNIEVWKAAKLIPSKSSHGEVLAFHIPAEKLPAGLYTLYVAGATANSSRRFSFQVIGD